MSNTSAPRYPSNRFIIFFALLPLVATTLPAAVFAALDGDKKDADKPPATLTGDWSGELIAPFFELKIVFRIEEKSGAAISATISAPDKSPYAIPVTSITRDEREIHIDSRDFEGSFRGRINAAGDRIRGEWTTDDNNTLDLELERIAGGLAMERPQSPKAPFPYRSEEVIFDNPLSHKKLAGTLTLPESRAPIGGYPAVVLVSDNGPHDRDASRADHRPFAVIADHLTRNGIAVLRYDDRGVGKSGGEHDFGTTMDFATDAYSAVEFLALHKEIQPEKIGIIGHGEGGLIAPVVAKKRTDVAFVILLGTPALRGDFTLLAQNEALTANAGAAPATRELIHKFSKALYGVLGSNPAIAAQQAEKLGAELEKHVATLRKEDAAKLVDIGTVLEAQIKSLQAEKPWLIRYVAHDPAAFLDELSCPLLALTGELDLESPPTAHLPVLEARLKVKPHPDFETRTLKGLNHLFQTTQNGSPALYGMIDETFSPTALKVISDWILEKAR